MSNISTCQQRVDSEKFGQGFDGTFKKRKGKPGTTVYVAREGKLVEKQETVEFMAVIQRPGSVDANYNSFVEEVTHKMYSSQNMSHRDKDYSIGTAAELPSG